MCDSKVNPVDWDSIYSQLLDHKNLGDFCRPYMRKATQKGGEVVVLKYSPNTLPHDSGESMALQLVSHPNIVQLLDVRILSGKRGSVLVLPFIKHEEFKPRTSQDVTAYCKQLLSALAQCHEYKLYHHDLKPENVLYDKDNNRVVLVDFGNSIWGAMYERFSSGIGCSTLVYSPPETLVPDDAQSHPLGSEVDMWSFGTMLAQMLLGRQVFEYASPDALLEQQRTFVKGLSRRSFERQMPNPSLLTDNVWNLLASTLILDPAQRINAADALRLLEETETDAAVLSSVSDAAVSDSASDAVVSDSASDHVLSDSASDDAIADSVDSVDSDAGAHSPLSDRMHTGSPNSD